MDDDFKKSEGADGWVDPYGKTEFGLEAVPLTERELEEAIRQPPRPLDHQFDQPHPPHQAHQSLQPHRPPQSVQKTGSIEEGKVMALVAHSSVLLGMPLFVIPMMQRDNEFALHHGKAAAVNFIFFLIALAITVVTCGLGFPLIFLVYVPMIIGFVDAMNGRRASGLAWGSSGERMFPGIQIKDAPPLIE